MSRFILIVLFLNLIQAFPVKAQKYPWVNYTTEDGLPTNYVYGAVEAADGIIWIYTEDGLVRFDGHTFQTHTIADGLPDNDVYLIEKDKNKICWISSFGNNVAYVKDNEIRQIAEVPEDINGRVVIINSSPMILGRNSFKAIDAEFKIGSESLFPKVQENRFAKNVFQGAEVIFNYVENQIEFYFENAPTQKFKSTILGSRESFSDDLINDPSPNIFIGAFYQGFFIYNRKTNIFKEYHWKDFNIKLFKRNMIHVDWPHVNINHGSGFVKIDSTGNIVEQFISTDLINNYEMRNFISDSKGNIWAGSRDGGLFFLSKHNRKNQKLWETGSGANIVEKIVPITEDRILFFADQNQPILFANNKITTKPTEKNLGNFTAAYVLPNKNVLASYPTALLEWNQDLEAINYSENFSAFDNKCTSSSNRNKKHSFYNLKSMVWDQTSNALVASSKELLIFTTDQKNNKLIIEEHPAKVKDMTAAKNGGVWIGTSGTINKHFQHKIDSIYSHPDLKYLTQIYDAEDFLYLATEDKGILRLNLNSLQLEAIFSTTNINSLRAGNDNTILASTNDGILRIEKESGKLVHHYKKSSGISANQVLDTYENDNALWVASSGGIDRITNTSTDVVDVSYQLNLNSITVNNKILYNFEKKLNLSSQENAIKFSYHLLDYTSGGDITYYTRLSPLQNEWVASMTPEVSFIGLAPGKYSFALKAKRFNGQEIIYPDTINIKVSPPLQKNPWTYLILLSIGFIGFNLYLKQKQRLKEEQFEKEKKLNKKISETQLSALRSQMNPHFIFNALGAIQYFVQTKNTDLADDYLSDFALLMRNYLEASKQPTILLKDEINLLKLYTKIEAMRFDNQFKTIITTDENLDLSDIRLPSVLIQPFVENSILHGLLPRTISDGLLKISFSQMQNVLLVKITDNGIGLEKAKQQKDPLHKSRGLENIMDRIKTLKMATGFEVKFTQSVPYPENKEYPGHEVLITFEKLFT